MKRSLSYRLKGQGAVWLQQEGTDTTTIYNRVDFILDYCTNKKVLHIGLTDHPFTAEKIKNGTMLHQQLQKVAGTLTGIDIVQDAIDEYIEATGSSNVFCADVMEQYPGEVIATKPEVILFSEVMEHLKDPYKAVDNLFSSFEHGTKILVTVPNYTCLDSIAASLNKTESVHPDHHWYFSPYTLVKLFDSERFTKEQLHFGMYYQYGTKINPFLKQYPYNGDCIMAIFSII